MSKHKVLRIIIELSYFLLQEQFFAFLLEEILLLTVFM